MFLMDKIISLDDLVKIGNLILSEKINSKWNNGYTCEESTPRGRAYHYVESEFGDGTTQVNLRIVNQIITYLVQVMSEHVEVERFRIKQPISGMKGLSINQEMGNLFHKLYYTGIEKSEVSEEVKEDIKRKVTTKLKTLLMDN
jgi:hypothetical protein